MALVEREKELAYLKGLFVESVSGRGQVAVVSGPVASGKSELLFLFAEHAVERGAVVLHAVADRIGRSLPAGVLRQLVQAAPFETAEGERLRSRLNREGPPPATEAAFVGEQAHGQLMSDLWSAVLELSANRPVLVVVDDVQHSDSLSLESVMYLIRRLRSARVMVVLGESDQAQRTPPNFHTELLRQPYCHRIRLSMLTKEGVARVLTAQFGERTAYLVAECHEASGGNPLLLLALVDDHRVALTESSSGLERLQGGPAFAAAVVTCLHRGGPAALEAARGLAVLGDEASPGLLGALLGTAAGEVEPRLEELRSVGVLVGHRFRHPVVRSVVLEDMSAPELADLRHRAAERLHHNGASAIEVARHLIAADRADERWVLPVLREAAEHALAADDVDLTVRCLRLAYRVCDSEEQRAMMTAAIVKAEWRVNPLAAAQHLGALAAALHAGHLPVRPALALIRYQLWHGQFDAATEALKFLGDSLADSDAVTAGMFRATQDWLRCSYPPAAEHVPPVKTVPRRIPALAGKQVRAAALLADVLIRSPDGPSLRGAEQILRGMVLSDHTVDIIQSALLALVYAGQTEKAARWCDQLFPEAVAHRAPTWQALLSVVRAEVAFRRGNLVAACRHGATAMSYFPLRGWGTAVGIPLSSQILALTAMGRHERAAEQLALRVPAATFQTRAGLHYLHARGHHHLATGNPDAALEDFLNCGESMMRWGIDQPGMVPWRTDAAAVYLYWGDQSRSRKLVEEQLAHPGGDAGRAHGVALRLLAATHPLPKRVGLLRKAIDVLHTCGDQLELARTLTDLSLSHQALGEVDHAKVVMSEALQRAKECRAEPLRRILANAEIGPDVRIPHPSRAGGSIASLSEAERRVVAFASMGDTNREIATKLHITVSTVEQHLTRAYRKLNVSSRTDLPLDVRLDVASTA